MCICKQYVVLGKQSINFQPKGGVSSQGSQIENITLLNKENWEENLKILRHMPKWEIPWQSLYYLYSLAPMAAALYFHI